MSLILISFIVSPFLVHGTIPSRSKLKREEVVDLLPVVDVSLKEKRHRRYIIYRIDIYHIYRNLILCFE